LTIVRFRVDNVYRDYYVCVYFGNEQVYHKQKKILTPGEMEQVQLPKVWFEKYPDIDEIKVVLEEA
jgi:hypothetical protein